MSKTVRATAFPLAWPENWPRTKTRERSRLTTTLNQALLNVQDELRRFGNDTNRAVSAIVISSNYTLGDVNPSDPGVAVYFTWDEQRICFPADKYTRLEANLQAIAKIIEAQRAVNRHGGLQFIRQQFRHGVAALPAPDAEEWWTVLGVRSGATVEEIETAYRTKAKTAHPDGGGSDRAMAKLNAARAAGKAARNT